MDGLELSHIDYGPLDELQHDLLQQESEAYAHIEQDFPGEPVLALAAQFGHATMRAVQRQLDSLASATLPQSIADRRRRNLSPHATRILSRWIQEHAHSPYPTEEQKVRFEGWLCQESGRLTHA